MALYIWLAVLADGLAGLAGGLLSERTLGRHLPALIGFAAGALLATVFLELLPELTAARGPSIFGWVFAGFLLLTAVEAWLGRGHSRRQPSLAHAHAHEMGPRPPRTLPAALLASDALHNFGDGAAVAAAFLTSPSAGVATAIAIIAHEVPQEMGDYALLRAAGLSRARALLLNFAVQLTAFPGAALVLVGARVIHGLQDTLLALASGMFLYIGATDLLPELHAAGPARAHKPLLGFVAGIALVAATGALEHALAPHA
ncbi:ZIP family metal transporter [Myxococcaceae bacterium GXIMD 01537]